MATQKQVLVTGNYNLYFTRNSIGVSPLVYLENMMFYLMGIPYFFCFISAMLFYAFIIFKNRAKNTTSGHEIIKLVFFWILIYFLILSFSYAKFDRYLILIMPFIAIITAAFITNITGLYLRNTSSFILQVMIVLTTSFYTFAFSSIYSHRHTWDDAAKWMGKNIPEHSAKNGTKILLEYFEVDYQNRIYNSFHSTLAENTNKKYLEAPLWTDNIGAKHLETLYETCSKIKESNYIIISDRRWVNTYSRLPHQYPAECLFYRTLFTEPEKLGFKLVYEQKLYPSFLGITLNDDNAEYMFQYVDHPHVYIFKRIENTDIFKFFNDKLNLVVSSNPVF